MNNKKIENIISNPIISFLIILPYIKPASELTGSLDIIFDIGKLVFFPIIICAYIIESPKMKNKLSVYVIIIQIIYLISTIASSGDLKSAITQSFSNIGCAMYFESLITINYHIALKRITFPLVLFAIITSITMFVAYPNGLYAVRPKATGRVETSNYFWGFDNSSVFKFIPAMLSLGLYSFDKNKKKTYYFSILTMSFISLSFLRVDSITAYCFCFFITVFYIIIVIKKKSALFIINYKNSIIVILVVFVLLALFNDKLDVLYKFASEHDKYYSIKARFIFWDKIFELFKKKPILGYGIEEKQLTIEKLRIDHPHNFFMDVIYRSGFMGILAIASFFYKFIKIKFNKRNKYCLYGAICFIALLMISQMDYYNEQYLFYSTLILCYYASRFDVFDHFKDEKNRNPNIPEKS